MIYLIPLFFLFIVVAVYKCFKSVLGIIAWVVVAIGQILLVVSFFALVAYLASKGWITI